MKRRALEELKQKPAAELEKLLKEHREHLRILKFDLAAGKVKNAQEFRETRKTIARLYTLLRNASRNND
ncbi:50S ribosomal protein L29 [Candidatus Parcubacteria bacterium]|nr:MAG: 50S ribosomal protein L29 [Candidatus Parcubacteria bacterium]